MRKEVILSKVKGKNNTKKTIKKLIKIIMEAIIVMIITTTMKIGNNSKSEYAEKK